MPHTDDLYVAAVCKNVIETNNNVKTIPSLFSMHTPVSGDVSKN